MSRTPSQTRTYRFALATGLVSMAAGIVMLLVDGSSNTTLSPVVFIAAGGFFTLLGLRGRAKARKESEGGSTNRNT